MKYEYIKDKNILDIKLNEELDINSCANLRNVIDGYIIKYEPNEVIIDLSLVKFMDSCGIGLLIGRYNLIKMIDSKLVIINPGNSIKKMILLTNKLSDIEMREIYE
ncbi:MAG: STAS domain-containing protein [Clostridia bacterium]